MAPPTAAASSGRSRTVGRQDLVATSPSHGAILKGMFTSGTQSPELTPEVRFMMADGDGDYCLPYSLASARHHLGDIKLHPLLVQDAATVEGHERQMEAVRETARQEGWAAVRIASVEEVATFDPLTACAEGSVLVMHLRELDGVAS